VGRGELAGSRDGEDLGELHCEWIGRCLL
jgi:hypothetical protein